MIFGSWNQPKKKTIPKKLLKQSVWERDKGICQICHKPVDQFNWELGHNRARSRGGKLTFKNTFVCHSSCNRSQQALTLKETRRFLGVPPTEEEKTKQFLANLPSAKLKYLAKKHDIVLRSKKVDSLWESKTVPPSKRQYVNALAKVAQIDALKAELEGYRPPERKPRKKKEDGWSLF